MALTDREKQIAGFAFTAGKVVGLNLSTMSRQLETEEKNGRFNEPTDELAGQFEKLSRDLRDLSTLTFSVAKEIEELKLIIDKRKAGLL